MKSKTVLARAANGILAVMGLGLFAGVMAAQETVLYTFTGGTDGGFPIGDLVQDSEGNFYGTTYIGGANGLGTVFEVSSTGVETVLYSFNAFNQPGDGAYPEAGLIFDSAGNLYGTTTGGGNPSFAGTVFELSPSGGGWTETILYRFCPTIGSCTDGEEPYSSLVFDKSGNLYGTTFAGSSGFGTVFEVSPNGSGGYTETVIHSFAGGTDGADPQTPVAIDSSGNLYGTSYGGGALQCGIGGEGCGLVYKLSPVQGGWSYTVIQNFTGFDGGFPDSSLLLDTAGNLYGTTRFQGLIGPCGLIGFIGCGAVFELSPNGSGGYTESVIYRFAGGNDGANPTHALTMDSSGNLYGTTSAGGGLGCDGSGCGTVFELIPQTGGGWKETILNSFNNTDGANPEAGIQMTSGAVKLETKPPGKKGCVGNCFGSCYYGGAKSFGVVYSL